jgi:hypothetical protein
MRASPSSRRCERQRSNPCLVPNHASDGLLPPSLVELRRTRSSLPLLAMTSRHTFAFSRRVPESFLNKRQVDGSQIDCSIVFNLPASAFFAGETSKHLLMYCKFR